jgi:pyruvate,water dikinase
VVTDVGGPLSHSSIVAREYGIPAVLGTAVATRRIRSGQRIRVDGDCGTVTLLDADDRGPEPASVADRPTARHRLRPLAGLAAAAGAVALLISRRHSRRTKIHAS